MIYDTLRLHIISFNYQARDLILEPSLPNPTCCILKTENGSLHHKLEGLPQVEGRISGNTISGSSGPIKAPKATTNIVPVGKI